MQEAEIRASEISEEVQTVYLGGGTPSLLEADQLNELFDCMQKLFHVSSDAEITIEANPDDLTANYLKALSTTPVNRLSIGIQSFRAQDLKWMNRAHNAQEAETCLKLARDAGFDAFSLDLIYGIPGLDEQAWLANLEKAKSFNPDHLSCYALTVEPGTALDHLVKTGKSPIVENNIAAAHFSQLMNWAETNDYIHYEISNFCKPGKFARHNTAYWKGINYLGLGPAAHSFNGAQRSWNIANNAKYVKAIKSGELPKSEETLNIKDQFNEMIMTGLRTMWGVNLKEVTTKYGLARRENIEIELKEFIDSGQVLKTEDIITLNKSGKLMADRIASELFWI